MSTVCVDRDLGADLVGLALFRSAIEVRDHIAVAVHGHRYAVSPVSAGFLCVPAGRADGPVAAAALSMGRPVAFIGGPPGSLPAMGARLAAETGGWLVHSGLPTDNVHFVVPSTFIHARRAALRHRQRPPACAADAPVQRVTAIGVGPWWYSAPADLSGILKRSDAVIATDWTVHHTLPRLDGLTCPPCHVVPYHLSDYDCTTRGVNAMLDRLRECDARDVALLVEGNPDTYDVLDGLCLARRELRLRPGVPIGLAAAMEFGDMLAANPFAGRLAYLSGLPARHSQSGSEFFRELCCYIDAGISCVLVEMTYANLRLVLDAVATARSPKTLVLLIDAYSPGQRELTARSTSAFQMRELAEHSRGKLTTLLIFDESRAHGR